MKKKKFDAAYLRSLKDERKDAYGADGMKKDRLMQLLEETGPHTGTLVLNGLLSWSLIRFCEKIGCYVNTVENEDKKCPGDHFTVIRWKGAGVVE